MLSSFKNPIDLKFPVKLKFPIWKTNIMKNFVWDNLSWKNNTKKFKESSNSMEINFFEYSQDKISIN